MLNPSTFSARSRVAAILLIAASVTASYTFLSDANAQPAGGGAANDDHTNMMNQLGIKTLRAGKSGQNQTGKGFDEATVNDWMPSLPNVLKMKDGTGYTEVIGMSGCRNCISCVEF